MPTLSPRNDETLPNFIKTKLPMKCEIRNKRKGLTTRPENENPQQGGEERGVRKSHVLNPVTRKMSKNERGRTPKKHPT